MQRVHSATIARQVSLLILAIIYYRSIHSCVHTTVLWRVEDTKHLSEHRACMKRGGRITATGRSKKDKRFHASLKRCKTHCLFKHVSHEYSSSSQMSNTDIEKGPQPFFQPDNVYIDNFKMDCPIWGKGEIDIGNKVSFSSTPNKETSKQCLFLSFTDVSLVVAIVKGTQHMQIK